MGGVDLVGEGRWAREAGGGEKRGKEEGEITELGCNVEEE